VDGSFVSYLCFRPNSSFISSDSFLRFLPVFSFCAFVPSFRPSHGYKIKRPYNHGPSYMSSFRVFVPRLSQCFRLTSSSVFSSVRKQTYRIVSYRIHIESKQWAELVCATVDSTNRSTHRDIISSCLLRPRLTALVSGRAAANE